jgi:hypothetical protein
MRRPPPRDGVCCAAAAAARVSRLSPFHLPARRHRPPLPPLPATRSFVTFEDEDAVEGVFAAGTMQELGGKKVCMRRTAQAPQAAAAARAPLGALLQGGSPPPRAAPRPAPLPHAPPLCLCLCPAPGGDQERDAQGLGAAGPRRALPGPRLPARRGTGRLRQRRPRLPARVRADGVRAAAGLRGRWVRRRGRAVRTAGLRRAGPRPLAVPSAAGRAALAGRPPALQRAPVHLLPGPARPAAQLFLAPGSQAGGQAGGQALESLGAPAPPLPQATACPTAMACPTARTAA